MVERTKLAAERSADAMTLARNARVLILEAPYYKTITEHLLAGALEVLRSHECQTDRVAVPGALELPQALKAAVGAGLIGSGSHCHYAGVVVLGCVIRGETAHYDIVCNNANHWLMETVIRHNIPFGNAVLTVDSEAQALARADGGALGKGGDAARACLRLIWLKENFNQHAAALAP